MVEDWAQKQLLRISAEEMLAEGKLETDELSVYMTESQVIISADSLCGHSLSTDLEILV